MHNSCVSEVIKNVNVCLCRKCGKDEFKVNIVLKDVLLPHKRYFITIEYF